MQFSCSLSLFTFFALSACGQDYAITDTYTQKIEAGKVKVVEIQCYCPQGIDVSRKSVAEISLEITGELSSVGYQGEQSRPESIENRMLAFNVEHRADTLSLISQEWTYIHHAFLIKKLKVALPAGLQFRHKKIAGDALEGRDARGF